MREMPPQSSLELGSQSKDFGESESNQRLDITASDDGIPIEDYAEKFVLSETEIWRRLRSGELLGRTVKGRLLIYPPESMDVDMAELPPLPEGYQSSPRAGASPERSSNFFGLSEDQTNGPELALLLDHLSLAKEENREILRLTDHSLRRVSELSDALVQMKDAMIIAKDAELAALKRERDLEIARLQDKLAASERENKKLKQQSEDLEMLARAMAQQASDHE